jgi:large subunit ribosomal protein L31e
MAKKSENKKDESQREYIIPFREKCRVVPRYKKTPKAIKTMKEFLARHMKIRDRDLNKIKIDKYLNEVMWHRGIKNPLHKIKVIAKREGEVIRVELAQIPEKIMFKKLRKEKQEEKSRQILEKKKTMMEKLKEKTTTPQKTKEEDLEDKTKEKEKQKAGEEATRQIEKSQAKQAKHTSGGKTKAPKHQIRKALKK